MIKKYSVSNFKAFSAPATLPIKPITLIYGPNSSGKSSILKSLLMLKQTLDEAENDKQVLVTKGRLVDAGGYRDLLHNHDTINDFSFKAVFSYDGSLKDTFDFNEIVGDFDLSREHLKLENSIEGCDYGIQIYFGADNSDNDLRVKKLSCYIGNESDPFMIYKYKNFFNEKEMKIFQEWKNGNILEYLDRTDILTQKEKKIFLKKLKPLFYKTYYRQGIKNKSRWILNKINYNHEYYKKNNDLNFNLYWDSLDLKNYLPVGINCSDYQYDFFDWFENDNSGNISYITISAANRFRKFLNSIQYIGPMRKFPSRTFSLSASDRYYVGLDGEYLSEILIANENALADTNEWLQKLNVGYKLNPIILTNEELGIYNLFSLQLVNQISGVSSSVADVGFGVSQILPVIVQSTLSKRRTLIIEQPELHLHPALQSEMGDLFISTALGNNKNTFIIETHSEHLLLRIMRRIRETTNQTLPEGITPIRAEDVSLVFIESIDTDGDIHSIVREMPLNDQGELVKAWPGGFFEEGLREVF